ncbi:YHS domain-containing (seleno)protein [Pelagibaculum spongiae]|uniref:YHS domain-containing (seleno)protein n=1 Tax=Pelagibaculum spongiae TaxID=2080658 RepID=UPI0015AD0585|nr:YHS domain-containing (seleno)protein [Pelagibaculum spongiae]
MNFSTQGIPSISKLLLVAFLMIAPGLAQAKSEIYTSYFSSTAVSGYDTVAYFTESKPVKGSKKFSTKYKGTKWQFKNAENLALFKADPAKYAPQYGGYCAWAVAQNDTAKGDPTQWTVHEGKLYLNYDATVQKKWVADKEKFIIKADGYWPKVLN